MGIRTDESKRLYNKTGNGYVFDSYSILQIINLIVKGSIRIDPEKVKEIEYKDFQNVWLELEHSLFDFFSDLLWGQFNYHAEHSLWLS